MSTDSFDRVREFAALIEEVSGNVVPEGQTPFLARILEEAMARHGLAEPEPYLRSLRDGVLPDEWRRLLPEITVNESFLYRVGEHFEELGRRVLPLLVREGRSPVRIWSAACAQGEEPVTLAMVLAESLGLDGHPWEIVATDVDDRALAAARTAEYGSRAVAGVPEQLRQRWLTRVGKAFRLNRRLRERIDYRPLNLVSDPYDELGAFDVVFLRNVLIYFRPEAQRRVLAGIAGSLSPGGWLFLGHSETLWKLSEAFESVELEGCFAYRRRECATTGVPAKNEPLARRSPLRSRRSTPGPRGARTRPAPHSPKVAPLPALSRVVQPDGPVPPPGATDSRPTVATAVAALRRNALDDARAILEKRLTSDPEDADAHALAGFVGDLEGRVDAAIGSYRAALFLEPSWFQVRLLLAVRLAESGARDRARAELREVLGALDTGRARRVTALDGLPLPDEEGARAQARRALLRL